MCYTLLCILLFITVLQLYLTNQNIGCAAYIVPTSSPSLYTTRCVAEDQRTFALGLQSSILRLVGFVPGPILFGTIVDSSCLFWQHECGQRGNCWLYDRSTLSTRAILLATGTMSCYILFIILCWFVYPHQRADEKNSDYYLGDSTSLTNVELECSAADLHHGDQTSCNSASSVREGAVEMQTQ